MKTLQRWVVGALLLFVFPVILPLAVIWALVYKIPVTLGGWILIGLGFHNESH
jgi:hypothetical protein